MFITHLFVRSDILIRHGVSGNGNHRFFHGRPGFYLSTAHPAKFGEVIASVTGARVPLPERLEELTRRPQRSEPLAVDLAALEAYVEKV